MSNQQISRIQIDGSDAENLSALFDAQLDRDAARFALKRLGQQPEWREACGRWQLAGDALRGNSVAPAPSGFAERVMDAIAHEPQQDGFAGAVAGATTSRDRARPHPRWIGGALAASVAIAALFVARPMFENDDASVDTPVGREIVSASSATGSAGTLAATDPGGAPVAPAPAPAGKTEVATGLAAAAIAASTADTSRRGRAPAASRGAVARATRSSRNPAVTAVAAAGPGSPTPGSDSPVTTRPFMPAGEIVAKPWPRAVLPGYPADTAMTAGFHSDDDGVAPISFYPFEPASLRGPSLRSAAELDRIQLPPPTLPHQPMPGPATRH